MNERIRQLAEQAKASVPAGLDVSEWIEKYNEIFAELIVQECIQNIRDNMEIAKVDTSGDKNLFLETLRTSGHFYIAELERNFGVES